jgi:hypothetical protein
MTQYQKIINYIEKYGSITPLDAFPMGITKLSTRVSEMRRKGIMQFKIVMESGLNQDNEPTRYARYSFLETKDVS